MEEMQKIADEPNMEMEETYKSDDLSSDSSGNKSDNDEMN